MDIANYFKDLDAFIVRVKSKIKTGSKKHKAGDILTTLAAKEYMVKEILKVFHIQDPEVRSNVYNALIAAPVDTSKLPNIAAMSWAMDISYRINWLE